MSDARTGTKWQAEIIRELWVEVDELEKQVPQWVSVDDGLPEATCKLLVCWGNLNKREVAWHYLRPTKFVDDHGRDIPAEWWMPLPEPPKGEDDG